MYIKYITDVRVSLAKARQSNLNIKNIKIQRKRKSHLLFACPAGLSFSLQLTVLQTCFASKYIYVDVLESGEKKFPNVRWWPLISLYAEWPVREYTYEHMRMSTFPKYMSKGIMCVTDQWTFELTTASLITLLQQFPPLIWR